MTARIRACGDADERNLELLRPRAGAHRSLPPILLGRENGEAQLEVHEFYAGVADLFETWVRRRGSAHTQRAYRGDVLAFTRWMGWSWPRDAPRFLTVSVSQVQDFRDELDERYKPKTVLRRLCSLSSWYRFLSAAAAELRLPINMPNPAHAQFIPRVAGDAHSPATALSIGEVRKVLALPETGDLVGLRDRAVLATFFYSGARLESIRRLDVEDLAITDVENPTVRLVEKGSRIRFIGLNAAAAITLRAYLETGEITSGALFRPARAARERHKLAARRISTRALRDLLRRYLEQLPGGDRYRPHSARATVATQLLDAGTDITQVQELLGHRSIQTTLVYDRRRRSSRDSASHVLPY